MAAQVWETPLPERVGKVAGKIGADAQQGLLAAEPAHAAIGGSGASTERRAMILRLAEQVLGRAAKDLAVAKSAMGGASGQDARLRAEDACNAAERCCDRLLLVNLLLNPPPRVPVPGAEDDFADDEDARIRAADALQKARNLAEDCASLVLRARQEASGTHAT